MAIDLDSIDISTAISAPLPWVSYETNNDTGEIINPVTNFNTEDFNDWCVKNLNSEQMRAFQQASQSKADLIQEAINDGDLSIDENGNQVWADAESLIMMNALIDPNLKSIYHKIFYQYSVDKGLLGD